MKILVTTRINSLQRLNNVILYEKLLYQIILPIVFASLTSATSRSHDKVADASLFDGDRDSWSISVFKLSRQLRNLCRSPLKDSLIYSRNKKNNVHPTEIRQIFVF